jgi:GAF domain-containing protein
MRGHVIHFIRHHRFKLLLFLALLFGTVFLEIFVLPESIPANTVWFIPIIAAVVLFAPRIAMFLVFLTFSVYAIHALIRSESAGLMVAVALPAFGLTALLSWIASRRGFRQINLVRDALDQSPLAYAEFSFPGYKLAMSNSTFRKMVPGSSNGSRLADFLPASSALNLAAFMDEAVSKRTRADCTEFRVVDSNNKESFWRIDVIPVIRSSRSAAEAVSLFAFDVTENYNRNRSRESALRISVAVMSSLEMRETLDIILQNLTYSTGADTGLMFLLEDEQWVGKAGIGKVTREQVSHLRFPYDDLWPAVEAVLGKRALNTIDSLNEFSSKSSRIPELDTSTGLVVPLISADRVIGAVWCIRSDNDQKFNNEQLEFATVVGSQAALAVENASIYENERAMRRSLEAIEAVSEAGLASLNLEEVLTELVTRTYDVMKMDAAMILLADGRKENLVVRATAGSVAVSSGKTGIRTGEGLAGKAFESSAPMKIDDILDQKQEMTPFSEESGIKSVLAVPLRINNETAGILQIGSLQKKAFSAREWGLIQVLADRASHAVKNSMLHEQTRQELARVELLRDVAAACAGVSDLKLIAQSALESVSAQMGCATAGIFYHDKKQNVLINLAFFGHPEEVMKDLEVIAIDRDTLLNKAVNECSLVTHDNWPDLSDTQAKVLSDLGVLENRRAALPIVYKDEAIGGMALTMPGQDPWSDIELDTLKSIANQMAVAIISTDSQVPDYTTARDD